MSNEIPAKLVKDLREQTGAGFMECKKALSETKGDLPAAVELLRKAGVERAGKKAGRATREGWIGSYIHANGKIGVMVEVSCETDFVAKTDQFQDFARDLSMQVAAMSPLAVSVDELDPKAVEAERNIFMGSDEVLAKPEAVRPKIVEGKLKKWYAEVCLLEQKFVKDDKRTIAEVLAEQIATIGENMSVRRFVRFELGEEESG